MNRKIAIILAVAAALLAGCAVGTILLLAEDDNAPSEPTVTTTLSTSTQTPAIPTKPTDPSQPDEPTATPTMPNDPTEPSAPTDPAPPTQPDAPTDPVGPDDPVEDPNQLWKVELLVTCEDGSVAKGAAVIATHISGRQEYEATGDDGVAVLYLTRGKHTLRVFRDGQHAEAQIEIVDQPIQKKLQLKKERKLYISLDASGDYDCAVNELAFFSTLEKALKETYPDAVFLTADNRYDTQLRDGDGLLTVEVYVENYTAPDQYFASEVWVSFKAYQECITVWDTDEGGEEIEIEYADGNICSIKIRNEYDYDYKNDVCVITESYYQLQRDRHFSKFSGWADALGYGYTMDRVLSTSTEQRIKAPGAGSKLESFWSDTNETRYRDYLTYAQELFPYVDLRMSDAWNREIEQLSLGT